MRDSIMFTLVLEDDNRMKMRGGKCDYALQF